ncbi:hypothetical protein [uncultured Dokdonia sp.]|uniref:hypothetical protein n=1 Tax=uncultured Dokdonia sp. TaxID=575653 RepID=UPI00260DF2CA|nr:hypothetical protein [uncultured Dokdonia sp.]
MKLGVKNKWYISAFIFALAIIGISLEQVSVPNQEIVIQFADVEVTPNETQNAIALVKSQLETIAADNIKIQELGNGTLKITYYSDVTVSEIKQIVSEGVEIAFNTALEKENAEVPSKEELTPYQLDVYEIQNGNDLVGSSGNVIEAKSEIIRFFTPDTYATLSKRHKEENNKIQKTAYICYANIAIAIDTTTYKIPEVRAGPSA